MPAERVAMRVVREVLRLTFAGVSKREVARRTGLASSTVRAGIDVISCRPPRQRHVYV
jgi:hypothetical protein